MTLYVRIAGSNAFILEALFSTPLADGKVHRILCP